MNSFFPATYSTLQPEALSQLIADRYDLHEIHCSLIVRGVSDTYRVTAANDTYILKVYRSSHRTLGQIQAETSLLFILKNAGISISYPIMDRGGSAIQSLDAVEGKRFAVLFSFAPGRIEQKLNDKKLENLGHEMARFHNISSKIKDNGKRWKLDFQTTLFQPLELLKPFFKSIPEEYTWWQETAKKSCAAIEILNPNNFSTGYCHFDLLPKNFHFENDSVTIFDFDFLGYGWLVYDVMTFWQNFALDVHYGRMTQEEADRSFKVFIDAYKDYRFISEDELHAVPYLYPAFWLFYMGFHSTHDQFYEFVKPDVLKFRTAILRPIIEKYLK